MYQVHVSHTEEVQLTASPGRLKYDQAGQEGTLMCLCWQSSTPYHEELPSLLAGFENGSVLLFSSWTWDHRKRWTWRTMRRFHRVLHEPIFAVDAMFIPNKTGDNTSDESERVISVVGPESKLYWTMVNADKPCTWQSLFLPCSGVNDVILVKHDREERIDVWMACNDGRYRLLTR